MLGCMDQVKAVLGPQHKEEKEREIRERAPANK
jgi:hypothetical protein